VADSKQLVLQRVSDEDMKHAQEMYVETQSVAGMRYYEWAA
jgi:hypothetical protein